jgi:hypothetical protein
LLCCLSVLDVFVVFVVPAVVVAVADDDADADVAAVVSNFTCCFGLLLYLMFLLALLLV